ncbi:MAG: hypothetical protein ACRDYY_14875, partial [Acidimicrobiales bacterium]
MYKQHRRALARARALAGTGAAGLAGGLLVVGTWAGALPAAAQTNPPAPTVTPPAPAATAPV